jgi:predicted mannosyl-3-phosphoglycerate phosphatase (HAD superfamily)
VTTGRPNGQALRESGNPVWGELMVNQVNGFMSEYLVQAATGVISIQIRNDHTIVGVTSMSDDPVNEVNLIRTKEWFVELVRCLSESSVDLVQQLGQIAVSGRPFDHVQGAAIVIFRHPNSVGLNLRQIRPGSYGHGNGRLIVVRIFVADLNEVIGIQNSG